MEKSDCHMESGIEGKRARNLAQVRELTWNLARERELTWNLAQVREDGLSKSNAEYGATFVRYL